MEQETCEGLGKVVCTYHVPNQNPQEKKKVQESVFKKVSNKSKSALQEHHTYCASFKCKRS